MASDDDSLSGDARVDLSAFRRVGSPSSSPSGLGLGFDLDDMMSGAGPAPTRVEPAGRSSSTKRKPNTGVFACLGRSSTPNDDWESDSDTEEDDQSKPQPARSAPHSSAFSMRSAYPLQLILADQGARKYFKVFASKEYSLENLLAWETLAEYLQEPNPMKRIESFITMSDTFFSENSPQHVNIIHPTQAELVQIRQRLDNPSTQEDTLEHCDQIVASSKQALELTNLNDIYLRFTRSADFDEMLRATSLKPPS